MLLRGEIRAQTGQCDKRERHVPSPVVAERALVAVGSGFHQEFGAESGRRNYKEWRE